MDTHRHCPVRIRSGIVAIVAGAFALTALMPQVATGQFTVTLMACKKVEPRGHAFGSELITRECGREFMTRDPYIGIVVLLQQVTDTIEVATELRDPEQASVWTRTPTIRVEPERGYEAYWIWGLLPVATDAVALRRENLQFFLATIQPPGKPVRERLGEWTLTARVNRGFPQTFKFTLRAAQ